VNEAIINHDSHRGTHYDKLVSKFSLLSVHSQQTESHENDIQYTKVTQKPA